MILWRNPPNGRLDVSLAEAHRRGRTMWVAWYPRRVLRLGVLARVGRLLRVYAPEPGVRVMDVEAAANGGKDYPVDGSPLAIFRVPLEHARQVAYTDGSAPPRPRSKCLRQQRYADMLLRLEPDPPPPPPRPPSKRQQAKLQALVRGSARSQRAVATTLEKYGLVPGAGPGSAGSGGDVRPSSAGERWSQVLEETLGMPVAGDVLDDIDRKCREDVETLLGNVEGTSGASKRREATLQALVRASGRRQRAMSATLNK